MTELGTALRELVDRQQPVERAEAGDLWTRGRQRVRRRRVIGAAVATVVVAALGMSALLVPTPTVVMPAGQPHAPGIPRDIYTPNQHLAGTAEKGPLGQLAVVAGAQRDHGLEVFGISARTGEYRFLDLPDAVPGPAPVLSPDGNHIAYWYGPYPGSTPPPGDALAPAHGAAIYDTRTGTVDKDALPSTGGAVPGTLTWYDDSTVSVSYGPQGKASLTPGVTQVWRLGTPPRPAPVQRSLTSITRNRDGSFLLGVTAVSYERDLLGQDGTLRSTGAALKLPDPATPQSATGDTSYSDVSMSGRLVLAVPAAAGALGHPLMVGVLPGPLKIGLRASLGLTKLPKLSLVGQLQETYFLGWRDDHTALVVAMGTGAGQGLFEADLRTRTVRRLGGVETDHWQPLVTVATDLVSHPLVAGRRPPNPQVPVAWLALAGLLAVAAGLWFVRRRPGA